MSDDKKLGRRIFIQRDIYSGAMRLLAEGHTDTPEQAVDVAKTVWLKSRDAAEEIDKMLPAPRRSFSDAAE